MMSESDAQSFCQALKQRYQCTVDADDFFTKHFVARMVAEKEHLIEAEQVANDVYFVTDGVLRVYYIDHSGNEVNQQFCQAGEVVAPVFSLATSEPSPFYLQALTDSRVLVADYQQLNQVEKDNIPWLRAENAILKAVY